MNASEEMLRRAEDTAKKLREQNKRLRACIEELEAENAWKAQKYLLCANYYPITEADIDKAWKQRILWRSGSMVYSMIPANELHIGACEECGGSGEGDGSRDEYGYAKDCPACNRNGVSHGWVWKEVK